MHSRGARKHQATLAELLAQRGGDVPLDDPLPQDLRAVVDRLTEAIRAPRAQAELAVAACPHPAAWMVQQVQAWVAYRAQQGRRLNLGLFPNLVLARLRAGDPCPVEAEAAGGAYDSYLTLAEADDDDTENPDPD